MVWTWDVIRRLIELLWLINIGFAVWTVFRSRRDIASTWAWLLVLSVFPVVGFMIYLIFGRQLAHDDIFTMRAEDQKVQEYFLKRQHRLINQHQLLPVAIKNTKDRMMVRALMNNSEALITFNNRVTLFTDGHVKFAHLIDDLNHAESMISLEYYTFYNDKLGKRILTALERAAARGVKVRVLYDASGSRGTRPRFFDHLRELGGEAQPFVSAPAHWFMTPRMNYHLHRKLVIIDHQVGYIGGFNIGDQYLGLSPKFGYWRDTHLRVCGQAAQVMEVRFSMDWNTSCRRSNLAKMNLDRTFDQFKINRPTVQQSIEEQFVPMQIVSSGPDNQRFAIRRGYENLISRATKYVYIQTPYLIPEPSVLEALIIAAHSGVDVRVMIPCKPDHPFVYRATEYYAKYLVSNGVKVYKYDHGFIHAKTVVADGTLASVGSANMDYRSFSLNFEVNAFCYSQELCNQLRSAFEHDLQQSTLLTPEYFAQQTKWHQFKEDFSRLLSPIL
ncbi:cardiolipin synthase [uncultured Limosilactobacillus sp.]|uniref:cardiolipin synthase n=1 Tax=uncultured Limosilactobacillus sp. TaxID=2837629 RepID=UPI0025FA9051|nr:cardiolipin synthase [uncultured Limosilactobacillus sp.]